MVSQPCTQPSLSGGHLGLLPQQQGLETRAGMGKGVCHLWLFVQTPQSTTARGTGCSLNWGAWGCDPVGHVSQLAGMWREI